MSLSLPSCFWCHLLLSGSQWAYKSELFFQFLTRHFGDILYKYLDFLIQDMTPTATKQETRINKLGKVSNHFDANHFYANAMMMIKH